MNQVKLLSGKQVGFSFLSGWVVQAVDELIIMNFHWNNCSHHVNTQLLLYF